MNSRMVLFLAALLPALAMAQSPAAKPANGEPNATTLAVLLANRPERSTQEQWLYMMNQPVNVTLFPLRITQAMLDTLDARELDPRFRYEMTR